MKRVISVILAGLLTVSCVACSGNSTSTLTTAAKIETHQTQTNAQETAAVD